MFLLLSLASVLILIGCQSDKRKSWTGSKGQFTVYYFEESEAQIAKDIAFFWKENDLLSGNKQDLQVRKDKKRFTVSMIAADPKKMSKMPFDEVQVLAQLKKKLYVDVFNQESFTLEICNNRFEAIYTVE
jgi:hypothetical protein